MQTVGTYTIRISCYNENQKRLPESSHCLRQTKTGYNNWQLCVHCPRRRAHLPNRGERSEPAVVDYKRMNVLVPVGGPTATNGNSPNREVRGNNRISSTTYSISSCCGSSYGDRQKSIVVIPNPQVRLAHQRLSKCALLRGHYESDLLKCLHCLNTNKTVP